MRPSAKKKKVQKPDGQNKTEEEEAEVKNNRPATLDPIVPMTATTATGSAPYRDFRSRNSDVRYACSVLIDNT